MGYHTRPERLPIVPMEQPRAAGRKSCRFEFVPCLGEAERLVALGFRHWVCGYNTGDISCWEEAWRLYSGALGPNAARAVVGDLACWVRSVTSVAQRSIEAFPGPCRSFCRDECIAVSMIAAAQHSACPALHACAVALIGGERADAVIEDARAFAQSLKSANRILAPETLAARPA
ncbi:MAG: hypothetical protein R3D31_10050 [Hyphomicrobiaceae bacterium]